MSRKSQSPTNLDEWLDFFIDKPLPVRASTLVRLRKTIDSPSSNLLSLAPIIRSDPMMVFQVTRAAQALLTPKGTRVASIDHAVQSLGFDKIEELLKNLQGFKLNPLSTVHTMFMRAVADSHHASTQAAEFARLKHLAQAEEIKLAALLYGCVHWFAWLYAPLHKEAYQRKVIIEGIDVALAEYDVFGCTLQSVGHHLAKHLNLPELTVTALSHDTSPSSDLLGKLHMKAMGDPRLEGEALREINHFFQQPLFPVKLSNWLALTATRGWNTPKAKRLYEIISDYLAKDKDATLAHLHSQCAQSAREYHQPGVLSPAAEILLLPDTRKSAHFIGMIGEKEKQKLTEQIPKVITETEKPLPKAHKVVSESKPTNLPSDFLDKQRFDSISAELQSLAEDKHFIKAGHIIKQLHKGLAEGLGIKRVLIFQVAQKEARLKPLLNSGFDSNDPLKNFTQDLKIPSIFKRSMAKPTFVWFSNDTSQRLLPLIPAQLEQIMPNNDWLLMSLFDLKGPLVMVYADHGHDSPPLNNFIADRFRFLCTAANQALKNLPQEKQ
ncbi:MAG: HDOD domain-containing protein [Oceanospirillales bacterium]|nr:MAG: HDOD domain-containing protein [Oceanospirillales bacterium]